MGKKHVVTPEELTENPELASSGVLAGDEIEITDDTNPNAGDAPIEPAPAVKGPVTMTNEERAAVIFEAMPHIHTIWFDQQGAWRFYETPGSTPIEKPATSINTNDL
jgi:hypothetical protein